MSIKCLFNLVTLDWTFETTVLAGETEKSLYVKDCLSLTKNTRYGYVTNSKVKFVIVVDSSNTSLRDNEIRSVSRTFPGIVIAVKVLHQLPRL